MRAVLRSALSGTIAFTFSLFLASCGSTSNPLVNNTTNSSGTGPVPSVTAQAIEVNGVAPNRKQEVQFSEAMNPDTINAKTFLITDAGGNPVTGTVTYDADYNVAMFQPAPALEDNTQYTATITTGAQSAGGKSLAANYSYRFTTRADTDSSPLNVTSTVPAANAQCISASTTITIIFNEAPDASTVTTSNIVVTDSTGNKIPVTLSTTISTTQVVATPNSPLPSGNITVTVSGIGDLADQMMQQPFTWTFSTACNTGGGGSGVGSTAAHLAVADSGNNRVLIYAAPFQNDAAASVVLGQADFTHNAANQGGAPAANTLDVPQSLAMDAQGDLYVADSRNCRVLEFQPPFTTNMNASLVIGQSSFSQGVGSSGSRRPRAPDPPQRFPECRGSPSIQAAISGWWIQPMRGFSNSRLL